MHVRFLHHRHQGSLRPLAWVEQAGVEASVPHAWHPEVDAAYPRVPLPLPIPIALTTAAGGALVPVGTELLRDLQLHQRLTQHPHPLAHEVGVRLQLRLAQQPRQCHAPLVGHRVLLLFVDVRHPDENHTVAVAVYRLFTHSRGLYLGARLSRVKRIQPITA